MSNCRNKRRYWKRDSAAYAAKKAGKRIHRCADCGHWHLTTSERGMPPETWDERRERKIQAVAERLRAERANRWRK